MTLPERLLEIYWKGQIMRIAKALALTALLVVLPAFVQSCATQREALGALTDKAKGMLGPSSATNQDITLISDKPNTVFYLKSGANGEKVSLGSGQTIKATVPKQGGFELFAKAPGYKEKSYTLTEAVDSVRFVFLEEERVLTIRSDIGETQFRIRPKGQSRWQTLGKGMIVEYWVPREGQFEVEAHPQGHTAQIQPVIDRTGELVFSDFAVARQLELASSEDYTRFLIRDALNGAQDWEYLGSGKTLKVEVPASGFEVSAKPLYHHEKRQLVSDFTEKLEFNFTEADREGSVPPAPVQRGETVAPRPLSQIGALNQEDISKMCEHSSWQALLIGISDYSAAGGGVRDLLSPVNDVDELGQLLSTAYGFSRVTILRNGQATRKTVLHELEKLNASCSQSGNLLIYYAGHGTLKSNGAGTWILADGEEVSNADLKDFIQRFPARRVLLISDSCYSGEFLTRDLRVRYQPQSPDQSKSAPVAKPAWLQKNLAPGRQVMTSGNLAPVSDTSLGPCQGHSPFSCALITALKEGAQPGAIIGVTDLYAYICDSYEKKGVAENLMPQRGALLGDEGGEFYFVRLK